MMHRTNTLIGGWYEKKKSALTLEKHEHGSDSRKVQTDPSIVETAFLNIVYMEVKRSQVCIAISTRLCFCVFIYTGKGVRQYLEKRR
jgi:hypothetical protein